MKTKHITTNSINRTHRDIVYIQVLGIKCIWRTTWWSAQRINYHSSFHSTSIFNICPAIAKTFDKRPGRPQCRVRAIFFKYSVMIEEQVDAVRHVPDEVDKAYAKVCREHDEYQRNTPHPTSLEELCQALKYFGGLCENVAPQTVFELSWTRLLVWKPTHRITFQSRPPRFLRLILYTGYCPRNPPAFSQARVLLFRPAYRPCQGWTVIVSQVAFPIIYARNQTSLRKEFLSGRPSEIPTTAPAIVKFTSSHTTTRSITDQDIAHWTSHPDQLAGLCFISTDVVRRIFYIDDYSVRQRKGPQYEVLYD